MNILISGQYNAFDEGWNGIGIYMASGNYISQTFKQPIYIGGSQDIQFRIENQHINALMRNKHTHNRPLQNAWNKHAEKEGFIWYLLEICDTKDVGNVEQKYLDLYRPFVDEFGGFNIAHFAKSPMKGKEHSIETKAKMSHSHKGWNGMLGKKHSEESKLRISNGGKGKHSISFKLISPTGNVMEGHNLSKFCDDNDLNLSCVSMVLNSHRKHHKGWIKA